MARDRPCDDMFGCLVTHENLLEFDWPTAREDENGEGDGCSGFFSFFDGAILKIELPDVDGLLLLVVLTAGISCEIPPILGVTDCGAPNTS